MVLKQLLVEVVKNDLQSKKQKINL